jgi:nucleotide-binding universal stress UspA family protein
MALARKHGASIRGLAVVDPELIAPPEPTPMGGDAYKQHKDAVIVERVRQADIQLAQTFVSECASAGLRGSADVIRGAALATLNAACAPHDIVVIGGDAAFGAESSAAPTVIGGLLRDNPRPLIVVPKGAPMDGGHTLVAYDGSIPTMRALQLFSALRLRLEHPVLVASAHPDPKTAAALADAGASYLTERGYKATTRSIIGDGDPAPSLIEAAADIGAGLIVAGAYGHRGWRQWLLGSTTEHLLDTSPVALFIHH